VENIQDSLSALTEQIIEKAHQSGYETTNRKYRAGHMAGVKFPGDRIVSLSKKLSDSRIYISWRGTSMRISPHVYNDANDMNRLCEFL
jgi:selenocysteine lyase/cysteine desulfurase